jgi:protein involved in polysaccharide export with SLBB domain
VQVTGRVLNPGHVPYVPGKKWKWYIQQAGGYSDSADDDNTYVRFADGTIQTRGAGISNKPNAGSQVVVPQRNPPPPTTFKDVLSGVNMVLATVITGLTIAVLIMK